MEIAKECNKPKGCLMLCGKNNSRDMIRCDGCGRWCHFKCMEENVDEKVDFLCSACKFKSEDIRLKRVYVDGDDHGSKSVETLTWLGIDMKDKDLFGSVDQLEVLEVLDDETKISKPVKLVSKQTDKVCGVTSNSKPSQIGCAEKANEGVKKKRQTKEIVLSIENNLSWWNDDILRNLRSCLGYQQSVMADANEGGVVPFVAKTPRSDGVVGGEICFSMSPCIDNSASWLKSSEVRTIHVNCSQLLKSWTKDESKALYQEIIKLKQKLYTLKGQATCHNVTDSNALNKVTQELEKSANKLGDAKERNRKLIAENNELKRVKKSLSEECSNLKNTVIKKKDAEIKNLVKDKSDLSEEKSNLLSKLEVKEQEEKDRNDKLVAENDSLKHAKKTSL